MKKMAGWCFFCVGVFILASTIVSHATTMIVTNVWMWPSFFGEVFSILISAVFLYLWHSLNIQRKLPSELAQETLENERRTKEWKDEMGRTDAA